MNNFIFENSTKVFFGKGCVKEYLCCLTKAYGDTVMLCYGGGSIKKNGIYDEVTNILEAAGKTVVEFSGIMANPTYTYSVPKKQMVSGGFDILSHIMEIYFSEPNEDNVSDDISEALMRSAIRNLRAAIQNPQDYTARSNLMWAATMAENRVIKLGKRMDFECHQMEHQLGAYTNCNHGEGLAVLHPVYYRHIYKYGLPKFKRFATEVMGVSAEAKTDEEIALAGIEALEDFIVEIGLPVSLQDLGVNENTDLKEIADSCALMPGSYKKMTHEEILGIFKECY